MREESQRPLLSVTKGTSGNTRPGGKIKTMPQETEEEAGEKKIMRMGRKGGP